MLTPAPEIASTFTPGLRALLTTAAFAALPNVGWIRVTGSDRVRWLNGMVTNNIATLKPGEGNYNFFLNAQGRIQADCTAFLQEDSILLETALDRIPALMTLLDHFIIMDDVELTDIGESRLGLLIAGPEAAATLKSLNLWTSTTLGAPFIAPLSHAMSGSTVDFIQAHSPVVPSFELWSGPDTMSSLFDELERANIAEATPPDLNDLRILSGTPQYGTDIRDKDLPQETNQTRALHFTKGCYLGQEIVERIRSRGAVHRTFTGFVLEGDLPPANTPLHYEEKNIGELTSVARIGSSQYALGYIRREALDKKSPLTYPGGIATPAVLPFQLPEMSA
jgi:folate-binding protein YgfZ